MRIHDNIPGNIHGILEVPLNFHQDIFASPPEENCAGFGVLALREEGKVLITELLDLEESALSANITLLQLFSPVDDLSSNCTRNTVHVTLTQAANSTDSSF